MKLRFISLLYLFSSSLGLAAFNETLILKKVADDGNQFVFVRKEGPAPWHGITIKDPQTKSMLYEARVTKCNATSCIGIVVRNHSGLKLRQDEEYLHSYNEKPIQYDPEKAPKIEEAKKPQLSPEPKKSVEANVEPKTEAKDKEEKSPAIKERDLYAGYGSPIGPGFKLGYLKKTDSLWVGLNYAKISSTTNSVSVDGHLLSLGAVKNIMQPTPSLSLNLLAELGVAKATIDFSEVDEDGPTEDETTYFLALGGEARLAGESFSVALRGGVSKAGFGTSYEGQLNAYHNPYGTVLVFVEMGVYYRF